MKILKLNEISSEVLSWKTFLLGRYPESELILDLTFDLQTDLFTKKFQQDNNLIPDGSVGPKTMIAALSCGFHMQGENTSKVQMLTGKQKVNLLGIFEFKSDPQPGNPENIKILGTWVTDNIRKYYIPQLIGIPGAPQSGNVYFHKEAGPIFQQLFAQWEKDNLMQYVLSWGGSFMPRFVRGSRAYLSNHAFGSAFDINAAFNPLGSTPAASGQKGSVAPLLPAAECLNVYWGGHFDRPDGMHFELGAR